MLDRYRYEKKYLNITPSQKSDRHLTFPKKWLLSSFFIMMGASLLGYLSFYYSSYILATGGIDPRSPLVKSKNTWLQVSEGRVLGKESALVYRNFYLSVPSLKINKAVVTTNVVSDKKEAYLPVLSESIAHYKGTSLPGQKGNTFLYGHSVLPQFFNSNDYMTIFSTLHKIKDGDEVIVNYGGKDFTYLVYSKSVVNPEELDVIDTSGDGAETLTLMTCSPPGTYLKRLIVSARLAS